MAFESLWMSARLDFEVLNVSLEEISKTMGLSLEMVKKEAEQKGWKQWFPEEVSEFHLNENDDLHDGDNLFELKANQFTSSGRKRLQVYQVAKQLLLAGSYARLESALIEKANEAINIVDPEDIKDIQALSSVLQSLTKDLHSLSQSMTLGTDSDSGLPQLIIRDLSGANS